MPNQLVRCVEGQVCKSDDLQPRIVRSDESDRIRFFAHDLRVTLEAQLRDRAPASQTVTSKRNVRYCTVSPGWRNSEMLRCMGRRRKSNFSLV